MTANCTKNVNGAVRPNSTQHRGQVPYGLTQYDHWERIAERPHACESQASRRIKKGRAQTVDGATDATDLERPSTTAVVNLTYKM
ncbi:MAG TPA: hypothetical protein DCE55_01790 [Planctomycetaceae bacterium]|nr:hypothetical protein [Planctomycetaceae bacterium]